MYILYFFLKFSYLLLYYIILYYIYIYIYLILIDFTSQIIFYVSIFFQTLSSFKLSIIKYINQTSLKYNFFFHKSS